MNKSKMFAVLIVCFFAFSTYAFIAQASVQCPKCHGTGKIPSSFCATCGGSGTLQPTVTRSNLGRGGNSTQTNVTATFSNSLDVEITGIATATVNDNGKIYTSNSDQITIPANGVQTITVSVNGVGVAPYLSCLIAFAPDPVTCPVCGGTGGGGALITCPDCGGTGYITEGALGGGIDLAAIGVPAVGVTALAVGVVASVVVVKKKRLTEGKVRQMTSSEFNNWVFQKLHGHSASILESRKGIDGVTSDGAPIVLKQSDNVSKLQIDNFINAVMQLKARRGIIVAFGFDKDAYASISRAKINYRIEIKALTVKELLEHKEMAALM
jgi:hypothetical protein